MAKRYMIGFKSIYLGEITKDDATGYTDATPQSLPYAGKMTMTADESTQKIYYDDALQVSLNDLKGYDVEINLGGADLAKLGELGLGSYDEDTGRLDLQMIPVPKEYSLRFVADTVDQLPFAIKYRKFVINSIKETGYNTRGESISVNEVIVSGTLMQPAYTGAAYCTKVQMLEKPTPSDPYPNQSTFDALLTGVEALPAAG